MDRQQCPRGNSTDGTQLRNKLRTVSQRHMGIGILFWSLGSGGSVE